MQQTALTTSPSEPGATRPLDVLTAAGISAARAVLEQAGRADPVPAVESAHAITGTGDHPTHDCHCEG